MNYKVLLLLIIIAIASFFRLWQLDTLPPGLYPDEAINGNEAITSPGHLFYPQNNGREGLFINLLTLSFLIFGPSIWALRLVSAVIGILTIFGIYLLSKELFEKSSRQIALTTAFLLAISFWHLNLSRLGFRAILVPFVLSFSFYFLIKGLKFFQKESSKNRWLYYFAVSGILFGLGFYTYTPFRLAVFILPFIFIPYWFFQKRENLRLASKTTSQKIKKQYLLAVILYLLVIFITALPLGLYFLYHPQLFISRAAGISIFAASHPWQAFGESTLKHLAMFNFQGDPNWRHNFAHSPMLLWPIGILFLIGLLFSLKEIIFSIKKKKPAKETSFPQILSYWLLGGWFGVMLLPGILTWEGIPHSLRVVGVIPPVYIFAGLGGWLTYNFFARNITNKKLLNLALILFFCSLAFFQYHKYFQKWADRAEVKDAFAQNYVKMGQYLNSLPLKMQKYVIVNQPGVPVPYPNGIPMPAQTIIFLQRIKNNLKNTTYLLPENLEKIKIKREAPTSSFQASTKKTLILPMREDPELFIKLWEKFPEGKLERKEGFWVFKIQKELQSPQSSFRRPVGMVSARGGATGRGRRPRILAGDSTAGVFEDFVAS